MSAAHHFPQVDAFILAGGMSSRMGRMKSLLDLGGVPLIVRMVRTVEPLVNRVTVVGTPERYAPLGLRAIADQEFGTPQQGGPYKGPLIGIATALSAARTPWNLILACDLPFLTPDWVTWLVTRAAASQAQVVLPISAGGAEPLAAVYRAECAAPIVQSIRRGVRKVTDALQQLSVEILAQAEWSELDPDGFVLKNVNTPADYEEARRRWKRKTTA